MTAYDATMIIGQASVLDLSSMSKAIEHVGNGFGGASGEITFLDNGDVGGAGYDICTYGGDDTAGTYTCSKKWTVANGVETA